MRDILAEDAARSARAGTAGREARAVTTSRLDQPTEQLLSIFGTTTRSGAQVSQDTALNVATVRLCVNLRANLVSMLPVRVMRKGARGPKEQTDHPLNRLLRGRVGPAQNSVKWRHYKQVCKDLGGNGYTRIRRNTFAEIAALEFMRPVDTQPVLLDSGHLAYRYKGTLLQDYEVIHTTGLSTNGLTGRSPIADLRESIGLAMTAQAFAASTFTNGNRQPGVVKGPTNWTKEKAGEFLKFWQEHYAGAGNGGKTPVLFGGVEWANAGFTLQDAELLGSRKFEKTEIGGVYNIPAYLVDPEKATSWGTGIEQLNRGLVDYMLGPELAGWEAEMNDKCLSEREKDQGYYVKFFPDALLRGDLLKRAQIYEILRRIRAIDVNQIRELEDWSLYPDAWAGDPRLPMNAQQSGNAVPAGAGTPEPDPTADPANA